MRFCIRVRGREVLFCGYLSMDSDSSCDVFKLMYRGKTLKDISQILNIKQNLFHFKNVEILVRIIIHFVSY